jgi:hypothetical protein
MKKVARFRYVLAILCGAFGFVTEVSAQRNAFGYSVACAGDVNNDGYPDLLIGAPLYYDGNRYGKVYLILGGPGVLKARNRWIEFDGYAPYNKFGFSVSGAGDVNGDGIDDFVVGAMQAGRRFPRSSSVNWDGEACIYFGRTGFDGTGTDLVPNLTLTGTAEGERFGWEVAGIGDVNEDGFDDVIASSSYAGHAYVFFGGATMDSVADLMLVGESPGDSFGWHVSKAGDVNNDGVSDFIVTLRDSPIGGANSGRAHVYFGGAAIDNIPDVVIPGTPGAGENLGTSSNGVGDVNGDGIDDILIAAAQTGYLFFGGMPMDSLPDVTFRKEYVGKSTSGLGDLNNDGFADVVLTRRAGAGAAYVYYGGAEMDTIEDAVVTGPTSTYGLGWDVAPLGDFNGDGRPDWVIGAPIIDADIFGVDRVMVILSGTPDTVLVISADGVTAVSQGDAVPDGFTVYQNYPNPFNPSTTIRFTLPERGDVVMKVYDVLGREVETLIDATLEPGAKEVEFAPQNLSSGVYFYQVRGGTFVATRKMILMK